MLDGAPVTPKQWKKEIKALQTEIQELDKKIEKKYAELICGEAIEETVKRGGKAKSIEKDLQKKKGIVAQKNDEDNPGNDNPNRDRANAQNTEEQEVQKRKKPSWDAR